MIKLAALAQILLAGCATTAADRPIIGQWGGQHVGLEISETGGTLDYDCARGAIDGPLVSDPSGRFVASGTHVPGTGGPVQVGVTPRSYPATYSGSVSGDTMNLLVEVPAISARIGPYALRRGAEPVLLRCL